QLQRMLVDPRTGVPQIIGADDRRVAPGIAKADRALFQHRDVLDAVLLGEVVGGCQPVPAAADDDHLIARPRRRFAPGRLPGAVPEKRVAGEGEGGISLHARRLIAEPGRAKPANRPRSMTELESAIIRPVRTRMRPP